MVSRNQGNHNQQGRKPARFRPTHRHVFYPEATVVMLAKTESLITVTDEHGDVWTDSAHMWKEIDNGST